MSRNTAGLTKKNHMLRRLAGLAVAAALSLGVASPVGLAQYGEEPPPIVETPSAQLKNCIKKAKKKFRNDPVKKKKAIKKCKKKYG